MKQKINVLMLGDSVFSPSGVGHMCKIIVDALMKTGDYKILYLGGAVKHFDYRPTKIEEYGDDFVLIPVDGYGTKEHIRSFMKTQKFDIVYFMTDPRFWTWLWEIEQEIRANASMVYYHVWDNYPYPKFNRKYYLGTDKIVTISKLTSEIVRNVSPEVDEEYLPHAVDSNIFKPLTEAEYVDIMPKEAKGKTVYFWTNRNARRKLSGTVLWWFSEFANKVGKDKVFLFLHTDPKDPAGQDLEAIAKELGLTRENLAISANKLNQNMVAKFYNMADCTINIADAEGFGLSQLESLSCGTPVIFNKTGGLQDTGINGDMVYGVALEPKSQVVIGSQDVPYIFEDRVSKEDFISALEKIHNMTREERKDLGLRARNEHVLVNFNFNNFCKRWDEIMKEVYEKNGSWETRKNYKGYTCEVF